jgi:hypothetical protein
MEMGSVSGRRWVGGTTFAVSNVLLAEITILLLPLNPRESVERWFLKKEWGRL